MDNSILIPKSLPTLEIAFVKEILTPNIVCGREMKIFIALPEC